MSMARIVLQVLETIKRIMTPSIIVWAKAAIASFLTAIQVLIMPKGAVFVSLLILMIMDWIIGTLCAVRKKEFGPEGLRDGVFKLFIYGAAMLVFLLLDIVSYKISELRLIPTIYIFDFLLIYLSLTEAISILKKLNYLGFEVPERLVEYLTQQKDRLFGTKDKPDLDK